MRRQNGKWGGGGNTLTVKVKSAKIKLAKAILFGYGRISKGLKKSPKVAGSSTGIGISKRSKIPKSIIAKKT